MDGAVVRLNVDRMQQMRAVKAAHFRFERLSSRDFGYAINLAIAALITYVLISTITPLLVNRPAELIGVLWAVISAVFVIKDTRENSLSAGISRLIATAVSFALCLGYLFFLPANPLGMAILISIGTLLMMVTGRRDEINSVALTTAVILIVAAEHPQSAWQQPLLRLVETVAGVAVGLACKWVASFLFFHVKRQEVR